MNYSDINDPLFAQALQALDAGDTGTLEKLITEYPRLIRNRLIIGEDGYFKDPYLIWFVADNPIRNSGLPPNITDITRLLVEAIKREAEDTFHEQIDYALGLVATGRIPRECGVQIGLMDILIDAGAKPGGGMGAFAHGNVEAAKHLIDRGGKLTFAMAVCLEYVDDINHLCNKASPAEKLTALAAAAFYGKTNMVRLLLTMGADPNGYPESASGFHSHATPLHQAVCSGSLDTVQVLTEAGAGLGATDKIYSGTPLDWAIHMQTEASNEEEKKNFALIEAYL
ncbi:ankyrin repeat domain-containing protein [Mucilaginibacter ginsenosidivorans]|nr:ankyrin repeat domain-containing protein [Mucilaginibacter ginsenosidivorans]